MQALWSTASTEPGSHVPRYQIYKLRSPQNILVLKQWSHSSRLCFWSLWHKDVCVARGGGGHSSSALSAYILGAYSWDTFFQSLRAVRRPSDKKRSYVDSRQQLQRRRAFESSQPSCETCEWRSLQMTSAPATWVTSGCLCIPSEAPDIMELPSLCPVWVLDLQNLGTCTLIVYIFIFGKGSLTMESNSSPLRDIYRPNPVIVG